MWSPNIKKSHHSGSTIIQVNEVSYVWTIENYRHCRKSCGSAIKSDVFSSDKGDSKWHLILYPNGRFVEGKNNLSLFVELIESTKPEVWARCVLSIGLSDARRTHPDIMDSKEPHMFHKKNLTWGFDYIEPPVPMNKFLVNGKLIIYCELTIVEDVQMKTTSNPIKIPDCKLEQDLRNMLSEEILTDVTLIVKGQQIQAHKNILAARSSVFRAMFETDMSESSTMCIKIDDIDYETMKEVLSFIYTGLPPPNLMEKAQQILPAANKYFLEGLKTMCEESICRALTVENVCDSLCLADLYSAGQLKARCLNFISMNAVDVMKTEGWISMKLGKFCHLGFDIIDQFMK